jgi:hypothetical protein
MDSDANYKALGYELRRLYADNLLSLERQNERVKLHAVNHGTEDWHYIYAISAYDIRTGEILKTWDGEGERTADSAEIEAEIDVTGLNVSETMLIAEASGCAPAWMLLNEPKAMQFGPAAPLLISTAEEGVLTIQLDAPVVDLMFTSDGDPSPFKDNFVTSMPGLIEVRCDKLPEVIEARSLAGAHKIRVTRSRI